MHISSILSFTVSIEQGLPHKEHRWLHSTKQINVKSIILTNYFLRTLTRVTETFVKLQLFLCKNDAKRDFLNSRRMSSAACLLSFWHTTTWNRILESSKQTTRMDNKVTLSNWKTLLHKVELQKIAIVWTSFK